MLSRVLNPQRRAVLVEFFRRLTSPEQPIVWLLALFVGILSGYAALAFYTLVAAIQRLVYGAAEASLESGVAQLDWYVVLIVPIIGGLIVGVILAVFSQSGRPASVAEVIESSRIRNCELSLRSGAISFVVSVVSLGFGASSGREGPVVHAGATIASQISHWLKCSPLRARTLLGCAAAAAVSSSFNAPIAGALFAMEVVLGYYAVKAFAPVVIASVAGAMISREHIGDFPAFSIPLHELETFWELPAFALLGIVCAVTATLLMWCIIVADGLTDKLKDRWNYPLWLEPVVGGALLGVIAIGVPQTIGVGYETTTRVLNEQYGFWFILIVIAAKLAAVASRFQHR